MSPSLHAHESTTTNRSVVPAPLRAVGVTGRFTQESEPPAGYDARVGSSSVISFDAGAGTWAAKPSSTELPASGMDVTTTAIIYKTRCVEALRDSDLSPLRRVVLTTLATIA